MKKFRIKSGWHYPCPLDFGGFLLRRFKKGTIYQVRAHYKFENNCAYYIGEDQSDVNKLLGLSFGFHHNNSIRLGWRFHDGRIEICGYLYRDGIRKSTIPITSIPIEQAEFDVRLKYNSRLGTISVELLQGDKVIGADVWQYTYPCKGSVWSYGLGLYFGGNRTAPHDMTIIREDLKVKFLNGKS